MKIRQDTGLRVVMNYTIRLSQMVALYIRGELFFGMDHSSTYNLLKGILQTVKYLCFSVTVVFHFCILRLYAGRTVSIDRIFKTPYIIHLFNF